MVVVGPVTVTGVGVKDEHLGAFCSVSDTRDTDEVLVTRPGTGVESIRVMDAVKHFRVVVGRCLDSRG